MNRWWGYVHTNGSFHLKSYWDSRDIEEANESPFCQIVVGPVFSDSRDRAIAALHQEIINKNTKGGV